MTRYSLTDGMAVGEDKANMGTLPNVFCWTRFGTEAGQTIQEIFRRKEEEREANCGLFLWGVGNALGPSIAELTRRVSSPIVVFSPTRAEPSMGHRSPSSVLVCTQAKTFDGKPYSLPPRSLVTSRDTSNPRKSVHYALVCFRQKSIGDDGGEATVAFDHVVNLRTGRPVGASQVTAVVEQQAQPTASRAYPVVFTALLVPPYFVHLNAPVPLTRETDCDGWSRSVKRLWDSRNGSILEHPF